MLSEHLMTKRTEISCSIRSVVSTDIYGDSYGVVLMLTDAMTSTRSYRDCLPQNVVREEIQRGRGRQFDPQFADIMLRIIDEDTSYELHE